MPALPRATGSPSRSSLERRVSLSAWSAGSYGSPTVYNCERLRQAHTPKSMAKPYDDDTDFTCVRRVVWKASAPLTSEFFGDGNRDGRPEFRAPFEKLVDEQWATRHRIRFGRPWD